MGNQRRSHSLAQFALARAPSGRHTGMSRRRTNDWMLEAPKANRRGIFKRWLSDSADPARRLK